MKRFVIVFIFAIGILMSMTLLDLSDIFNTLNISTEGYYSYIQQSDECVGNINILKNNDAKIFNFGDFLYIDAKEFDINDFINEYCLEIIGIDNLEKEDIVLYVLYCDNLPKYRLLNGKKYNIQIAINNSFVKLGYPAIFDSF